MADALPPPTFPLDIQPLQWTRVPALTTKLLSLIEALGPDDIAVLLAPTAARGARTRRRAELIDGIIATMFVNGGDERRRTSQHNSTLRRVRAYVVSSDLGVRASVLTIPLTGLAMSTHELSTPSLDVLLACRSLML